MKHHSALAICHLAFLAGIALYLGVFYPACRTLAFLLVLAGAAVECFPRIFQKPLVLELLLGAVIVGAWWHWPPSAMTGDVYRAGGMIVAYLLLIPSRMALNGALSPSGSVGSKPAPCRLKWLLGLAAAELVFGTRFPGTEIAALIVIAIGLLALAIDSWLAGCMATRTGDLGRPNAGASVMRWAIVPFLLVAAATSLIGTRVVEVTASYHAARQIGQTSQTEEVGELLDLQENISLGDHRSIERDPRIVARLTWENGTAPTGMVYLRALALPDLVLDGPVVGWGLGSQGDHRTPSGTSEPNRWAQLDRVASGSEVVLRPDGSNAVELPEITSDVAGNLYSAALRNREYSYRVGFDDRPLKADPAQIQRCLEVDFRLNALPWSQIEDPRWSLVSPERAAAMICSRLQTACSYDLQDLPRPMDGPGGVLRGFLFGPNLQARRGHCQYFATAAVLLMRRAGHPARCVGGFASDEIDPSGVTFRALHFHAWIEVVNSAGEWQRFDPSPESRMARTLAGVKIPPAKPKRSTEPPVKKNPAAPSLQVHRLLGQATPTFWVILLGGVAILYAFRYRKWFSGAFRPRRDPRMKELQRRNDDLIKVAISLGIVVTPATTLSDLVAALEARTNLLLGSYLQAHLAARFGQGPLPEPWPLEEIVDAGMAIPLIVHPVSGE